jgi:hypothetical protein
VCLEKSVAVFGANRLCLGLPDGYVTKQEKRELLASGDAVSIHRGKAIQLRKYSLRGASCSPSASMIHAAVDGHAEARVALGLTTEVASGVWGRPVV